MSQWYEQLDNLRCRNCDQLEVQCLNSTSECLCYNCFNTLPSNLCRYCSKIHPQIHHDNANKDQNDLCWKCNILFRFHGPPQKCEICTTPAAFGGKKICRHCETSLRKGKGAITECLHCKQKRAFTKIGICYICAHKSYQDPTKPPPHKKIKIESNSPNL